MQQHNGMATAALTCGIVSIIFSFFFGTGFIFAILGIMFACLSRRKRMNKSALWGLILSIIGAVVSIAVLTFSIIAIINSDEIEYYINEYLYAVLI